MGTASSSRPSSPRSSTPSVSTSPSSTTAPSSSPAKTTASTSTATSKSRPWHSKIPLFLSLFHDPHPHWAIINRCYISSSACGHPETNKKKKTPTISILFTYFSYLLQRNKQTTRRNSPP